MKQGSANNQQLLWARAVMRKWLNMTSNELDYSADPDDDNEDDPQSDSDNKERGKQTRLGDSRQEQAPIESNEVLPRLRRQKSLTSRSQYINKKELRVCVGTWNVGGRLPPDDLDIDDWIGINEPADLYVLGLQEIVPLNPGNIFGAEDTRPVPKWENIIRDTLNRVRPKAQKMKSFSDPPTPSKFKPADDVPDMEEEMLLESDSDIGEEVHPLDEEQNVYDEGADKPTTDEEVLGTNLPSDAADIANTEESVSNDLLRQFSGGKRLSRLNCFRDENLPQKTETSSQQASKLSRMISCSDRIGLSWPEPPLHLLSQQPLDRPTAFKSMRSFSASKSFRTCQTFKQTIDDIGLFAEIDLEALMKRKRRSSYVRIVSKQMVGIFITIWVRRSVRKHIQNLKVSTVGVGVMGYIGEKEGDEHKRNADVREIHQRTHFNSLADIQVPRNIIGHDRIIWLGDLNYRINLPYQKTRDFISKKQWSKLIEKDQLTKELEKGVFDGWSEGPLNFPPTYKYEITSEKYYGEDPKVGRRTPSWCDRILSYGMGMRLLRYGRSELKFSDHRPVTATYMAEVEVFSPRKLQKALTFTDAEMENEEVMANLGTLYEF